MRDIITERDNNKTKDIDLMCTKDLVRTINNEDKKITKAIAAALPEITKAVDIIADSLSKGGRLVYFGAGTSGRLGVLDASECWPTFSMPEEKIKAYIAGGDYALRHSIEGAEDNADEALKDIKEFAPTPKDIVVGISASGNPAYVLTALKYAKQKGSKTIAITSNPLAKINDIADIIITTLVGPEIISGSSRLKSGTAQKMVLNMLSTAAMVKIGKTYGNQMIDLQPACNKLIKRGNRIISSICKIPLAKADEYRIKADNNVKIACVMCLKNCSKTKAEKLLAQYHGILRKVLINEKI